MVRIVPAHIENGHIVPDVPLPENVQGVSILLETSEPPQPTPQESTLPRLLGILKDPVEPKQEYVDYLEEKYR